MKILKQEIKPIGHCVIELTENEVQTIIDVFEEVQIIKKQPYEYIKGERGGIYNALKNLLKS